MSKYKYPDPKAVCDLYLRLQEFLPIVTKFACTNENKVSSEPSIHANDFDQSEGRTDSTGPIRAFGRLMQY